MEPDDPLSRAHSVVHRLLHEHFADLLHGEPIDVAIGRRAARRLASVKRGPSGPVITVNPLLLLPDLPPEVLEATIAHELCHIVHGFGTANRTMGLQPHRGGIVDAELNRRGLKNTAQVAKDWCRSQWGTWYAAHAPDLVAARERRNDDAEAAWKTFLAQPRMRSLEDIQRLAASAAALAGCDPLGGVRWLYATPRNRCLSYRSTREDVVLVHGLAAHPGVPEHVILYQLALWLHRKASRHGRDWQEVSTAILSRDRIEQAQRWMRRQWSTFIRKHLPV